MPTKEHTAQVPLFVWDMPFNERWKWARENSAHGRLSHDQVVARLAKGTPNRSHLIKIEKGTVAAPWPKTRDKYADAVGVPRGLFAEAAPKGAPFRGRGSRGSVDLAGGGEKAAA